MNDKIEQRARELLAVAERGPIAEYGVVHRRTAHQAITAALREQAAPKPEAQVAGVDVRARYFLASGLDEYGHHSEAQNVRDGEDLESYRHELFAIKAALSTPASHDAQQPVRDEMSPDFTHSARAAIAWVLFHHQGGSSPVGQPLRFALGMGAHEPLPDWRIAEAKAWAAWANATTADFHAQQPAVVGDDGFRRAFYEIADVLEIGARPYSPEIAFQRDMLPRIRELAELAKGHEYQHSVAGDEVVWRVARALLASRRNTLVGVGQDPERAWNTHKACLYIDAQHAIAALTPAATPGEPEEYEFEVFQGGAWQAGGSAPDFTTAQAEANHYAMMYGQDGPEVEVKFYARRELKAAQKEGNGNDR